MNFSGHGGKRLPLGYLTLLSQSKEQIIFHRSPVDSTPKQVSICNQLEEEYRPAIQV